MLSEQRLFVIYQCKNLGDSLLTIPLIKALLRHFENSSVLVVCKSQSIPIFDGLNDRVRVIKRPSSLGEWVSLSLNLLRSSTCTVFLPHTSMAGLVLAKLTRSRSIAPIPMTHWLMGSVDIFCPVRLTSWRHTAEVNLDMLRKIGVSIETCDKVIDPTGLLHRPLSSSLSLENARYVLVHPGSRWLFKSPRYKFWETVIERLASCGYSVVVTGESEGAEGQLCKDLGNLPSVTNLAGQTDLTGLTYTIKRAVGFIGVDTFSTHLAAGLGVPGVVLFGPTSELVWGPYGSNCKLKVITSNHSCRPCHVDGCGGGKLSECLEDLDPAQVVASFRRQIELC